MIDFGFSCSSFCSNLNILSVLFSLLFNLFRFFSSSLNCSLDWLLSVFTSFNGFIFKLWSFFHGSILNFNSLLDSSVFNLNSLLSCLSCSLLNDFLSIFWDLYSFVFKFWSLFHGSVFNLNCFLDSSVLNFNSFFSYLFRFLFNYLFCILSSSNENYFSLLDSMSCIFSNNSWCIDNCLFSNTVTLWSLFWYNMINISTDFNYFVFYLDSSFCSFCINSLSSFNSSVLDIRCIFTGLLVCKRCGLNSLLF